MTVEDEDAAEALSMQGADDVFDGGDQVVALIKSRLRHKGTDAEFEIRNGHIWTIRDGTILSLVGFPSPEEALDAAGLREYDLKAAIKKCKKKFPKGAKRKKCIKKAKARAA